EAVRLALEQLDLTESQVDIEILSDAGPDEGDEALVRVTAKGMASQPVPRTGRSACAATRALRSADREHRQPGPRRVRGDRPPSRGAPPREHAAPPPKARPRDL